MNSGMLVHSFDSFRAAVYEHAVIFPADRTKILSRDDALKVMMKNLMVYKQQTELAALNGARIIVFPEYGLYGLGWTRQTLAPYLEYIPDPNVEMWNPCYKPSVYNSTKVQHMLSCMAKHNSIYIVANMGARQPCTNMDPKCPHDHQYQYSANVVYGPSGDFLARYFKFNLYVNEDYLDKPNEVELSMFDTPFGRFGTFSSLDIMYHDPAIALIEKMNITNIAYPTAWVDDLPLLSAIEFHSAFAEGTHTSLLAANLHIPSAGCHGSGLYWSTGTSINAAYYYNDSMISNGSLVVETLQPFMIPTPNEIFTRTFNAFPRSKEVKVTTKSPVYDSGFSNKTHEIRINGDVYTAVLLQGPLYQLEVCNGKLCCSAMVETGIAPDELYAFGAFDGMHTEGERYYLQACVFIKCANNTLESCGSPTKVSSSYMDKMAFSGNFTTKYVFPEVLTTNNGVPEIVTNIWYYMDGIIIDAGLNGATLSISIFGRDYSRDVLG
ncbi:hypothetical protein CHS0354_040898 [Potamilus streckersoni]|uniref:CN hydrolase domain-containing protein n=1 Tax=Potamilus streckersoni TaxID=2493646 RepID=A0AAE0SLA1_9BIVA|nr:hypothetical protein CHS0354_040898 [Potamilus streckersoni]